MNHIETLNRTCNAARVELHVELIQLAERARVACVTYLKHVQSVTASMPLSDLDRKIMEDFALARCENVLGAAGVMCDAGKQWKQK